MVSKRQFNHKHQGSGKVPIQEQNRGHGNAKQASFSGLRNAIDALCMSDYSSYLETFLRRVVREVVEPKIQGQAHLFSRKGVNEVGTSGARPLKLCFINKLPDTIFTRSNIIAEDESPLQIALFDVRTQSVVNDGPLSSLKIEIYVLGGDFGSFGSEDWTEDEFNSNIVRERDGREPLLIGERFITLENGVGCIAKIAFSDNSRWQRSRRFRIGVKVVQTTSNGEEVQEAYKKHYPPSLNDELWRLKKIAKEGKIDKQLSLHGIHIVKDLLRLYITNEPSVYDMFGSISKKSWLVITEHAKTCVIDDYKLYSYHSLELQIGLLFNSIYILVGVTFDWQNYYSPDTLTPTEKHLVEIVKKQAYKNVNNLKLIDDTKLNYLNLETCLKARQSHTPDQGLQQINITTAKGEPVTLSGYDQPINSPSYTDEGMHYQQVYDDPLPDITELPKNNVLDEFFFGMCSEGDSWHLNGSQFPFVQGGYSTENESSEIEFINDCPPYTTWEPETGFFFGSSLGAETSCNYSTLINSAVDISSIGKPKAWYKICVALKWVILVKRNAAARKNAQLFYYNY